MKINKILQTFLLISVFFIGLISLMPSPALAVTLPGEDVICGGPCPLISGGFDFSGDGVLRFLIAIARILTFIGVGLAILFMVWSGILFITGKDEEAKKGIFSAIIGLLVIILAYTVVTILISLLTSTSLNFNDF